MIYTFGDVELDEERYELRRAGRPIRLEPKAFRVLAYLIQHRDRAVPRDKLREQFWPGEFVADSALAHCIAKARQAVDDGGAVQRVIKTVHGHGYRFIAVVQTGPPDAATPAIPPAPWPTIAEEASPISETPKPLTDRSQTSYGILEGEREQATVLAMDESAWRPGASRLPLRHGRDRQVAVGP
jgi:DNA-binding winged helix-turn-helix (wHTH) protein